MKEWADRYARSIPGSRGDMPAKVKLLLLACELWRYHYGLSLPELQDLLDCSQRQVRRDIHMLEDCGLRIIAERAPPGHADAGRPLWRIDRSDPVGGMLSRAILSMRLGRRAIRPLPELTEQLPLFEWAAGETQERACA